MTFKPSAHSTSVARTNASGGASQNGWPASSDMAEIDIVWVPLPGTTKGFNATRKAADALEEMALWWSKNVEPIKTIYGHNYRKIRGGTSISNHGSGTAIDINAADHPLGASGTVSAAKRALITAKAASLGLRWGGDYSGRKDEMHFEVILPPTAEMFRKGAFKVAEGAAKIWAISFLTGGIVVGGLGFLYALKQRKKRRAAKK